MKSWPVAHLPCCINANTKEWQVRMGDAGAWIHRGVSSCPRMAVKTAVELDSSGVSYFCPMLRYLTKAAEGGRICLTHIWRVQSIMVGMAWRQEREAAAPTVSTVRPQRDECL